ncbi:MAG TPA: PDZ domain-containing protein [Vicinamibacterales bacterium]|jgi:hypothetical protein|nr:PDZ domain-containing protein [Vicinamibacterales bacterium]
MTPNRPSVSRDTRLLLGIVLVSIALLWLLARIRFPDRVPTPNPVPPVLAQLTAPSAFVEIAASVETLQPRLEPLIAAVDTRPPHQRYAVASTRTVSALRFRDDLAVALVGGSFGADAPDTQVIGATEIARDPASQLAVIRLPAGAAPLLSTWTPRWLPSPRVMIAAAVWRNGISFRPIFIGSLQSTASPTWMGTIWTLPPPVDLDAGTFVFTTDGALAGLAVGRGSQHALVPADTVLAIADRLARDGQKPRGHLGIEAQPLTPGLAAATGAKAGVIVSWVDPNGPAAGVVSVSDVIDRIGNDAVSTVEEWQAHAARLVANESIVLGVHHQNQIREVRMTASAAIAPAVAQSDRSPGLTLRTLPRVGATVTRVDPDSPAARAGLQVGDVLTLVGGVQAPTAAQAAHELAIAVRERPILIGLNRGATHYILALERTW